MKKLWTIAIDLSRKEGRRVAALGLPSRRLLDDSILITVDGDSPDLERVNAIYGREGFRHHYAVFADGEIAAAEFLVVLSKPNVGRLAGRRPHLIDRHLFGETGECPDCGIRGPQIADLALAKTIRRPKLISGVDYFYDIFVLHRDLLARFPRGAAVPTRPVIVAGERSSVLVQLDIDQLPRAIAEKTFRPLLPCDAKCGRPRFEVYSSDFFPAVSPVEKGHHFYRCDIWYGSGSEARSMIVIDQEVYRALGPMLEFLKVRPCRKSS